MNLLLAGGYDTSNLGDHAMLKSLNQTLGHLEDLNITILSRHIEKLFEKEYDVELIKNLDHETKRESLGRWFNGFNFNDNTEHLNLINERLDGSDALVIGGGRLFIDICLDFMRGPLSYFIILVILAKFKNIPIIIYGMTLVKPKTELGQEMLKFIVENSSLTMVRELPSKNILTEMKIKTKNLKVIPDPAFILEYNRREYLQKQIFKKENLEYDKNYIGLNLRFTNLNEVKSDEDYFDRLAAICDSIYEKYKRNILLISQMNYSTDNLFDDDRNFYRLIRNRMKNKKYIFILENKYSVEETLAVYNKIDMLFSMRRHGLIFAATQYIPIYGLVAEENTKYAMQEMGLEQNIIPLNKEINKDSFTNLLSQKDTINILKENIPKLSKRTLEYGVEISKLIK